MPRSGRLLRLAAAKRTSGTFPAPHPSHPLFYPPPVPTAHREQRRRAKEEKVSRREGDTKGGDEKASSPADALPPPPPPAEKRDTSPPASEHSAMDVPSDGGSLTASGRRLELPRALVPDQDRLLLWTYFNLPKGRKGLEREAWRKRLAVFFFPKLDVVTRLRTVESEKKVIFARGADNFCLCDVLGGPGLTHAAKRCASYPPPPPPIPPYPGFYGFGAF